MVSACENPYTSANKPPDTVTAPGQSSLGRLTAAWLCSSASPPAIAIAANTKLTYMLKRQLRYCVSTPPSSRPMEAPLPAIAL